MTGRIENTPPQTYTTPPLGTSFTEGVCKCINSCAVNLVRLSARVLTIAMIVLKHVSGVFIAIAAKVFELATAPFSASSSRREQEEIQQALQLADDEDRRLGRLPPQSSTPVSPSLAELAANLTLTPEEQLALMYQQERPGALTEEEELEFARVESLAQIDEGRRQIQQLRGSTPSSTPSRTGQAASRTISQPGSDVHPSTPLVGPLLSPLPQQTAAQSSTVPELQSVPLAGLSLSPIPEQTSTTSRLQFCQQGLIEQNREGTAFLSEYVAHKMSGARDLFTEVQTAVFTSVQSHQRRSEQRDSFLEDCKTLAEAIISSYLEAPTVVPPFLTHEMDALSHQTFKVSLDELRECMNRDGATPRCVQQKARLVVRLAQHTPFAASVDGLFQ